MRRIAVQIAFASIALALGASAQAEDAGRRATSAALFATAGAGDDDAALDPSLLAAIERLGAVRVTVRPGLDLETVQLAIDCAGLSSACLHAVAATSGVDGLIASTLTRTDDALVLRLIYFDAQRERIARSERKQTGSVLTPKLLEAIPGMLRELFGLSEESAKSPSAPEAASPPGPAPPEVAPPAADGGEAKPSANAASERALPIGPIALAGAGVLAIGGGVVAGLMSQSTHDAYTKSFPPQNIRQVDLALERSSRGKTEAVVANVLYGVGAATLVSAAVWFAIDAAKASDANVGAARASDAIDAAKASDANVGAANARERPASTALVPLIAPGELGLVLSHRGESL